MKRSTCNPSDAVMAGNDQMGIAAVRLLQDRGIGAPDRVAVTGFNAFEFRRFARPVLTSVESPAYDMGSRAGEELLDRLTVGRFRSTEVVLPTMFQRGETT